MKKLFIILVAIALVASFASAQLKVGSIGIQTSISGGDSFFGAVYNLSGNLRLSGELGFVSISPTGGNSTSNFTIGAGINDYLITAENLSTFVGGMLQFQSQSQAGVSSTGFAIAARAGAEYWVSTRFSVSGFCQLGFGSSGPSGATTSTFGTTMGTALTFYLN